MKNVERIAVESILKDLNSSDLLEKVELYAQRRKELMELGTSLGNTARLALSPIAEELSPEALGHFDSEMTKLLKMNFTYQQPPVKTAIKN